MRSLSVVFFALASLVQAQAQEAPRSPAERSKGSEPRLQDVCAYTIRGYPQEVPAGVNLCWRVAYPFRLTMAYCTMTRRITSRSLLR